jgi:hypothetical protein
VLLIRSSTSAINRPIWEYTTYDVMHPNCPYKQDLMAQFVKPPPAGGRKVGLYYCWRHPGFNPAAEQRNARMKEKTGKPG